MGLMDYTAVELGKKIKAGEVSVLEAANAAMDSSLTDMGQIHKTSLL